LNGSSTGLAESPFELAEPYTAANLVAAVREIEGPFEFNVVGQAQVATGAPQARSLSKDAFYDDEWAVAPAFPNPRNVHFNRFTALTAAGAVEQTVLTSRPNPLDPRVTTTLVAPELIPAGRPPSPGDLYWVFVPDGYKAAVAAALANGQVPPTACVSVLFGVGFEMNRHGLRSFFAARANRILIEVGGVESVPEASGPWGIGITDALIADLLTAALGTAVPVTLDVLAAYSTGYRGLNGTVNNGLVTLTRLSKLIFFDCLYRADTPKAASGAIMPPTRPAGAPAGSAFNTWRAVQTVTAAHAACRVIVYEVTPGGTPTDDRGTLRVEIPSATIVKLKPLNVELKTIILARLMDNGIKDGYFTDRQVPAGLRAIIPLLPVRGTLMSDAAPTVAGSIGAWAAHNAAAVRAAVGGFAVAMELARKHRLLGWPTPPTEFGHDGFLPEFGWEHLAG
jgi:hypothetical protein